MKPETGGKIARYILVLVTISISSISFPQEKNTNPLLTEADSIFNTGYYEAAILKYTDVISGLKERKDENKKVLSVCYEKIGLCYYQLDNYSEAIDWFKKTLELFKEEGDLESVASMLNNIGLNYKMLGNYDKAIEYYEQTILIDEELGKGVNIAKTLNNIGVVYRVWGKYDKAIEYFERSLRLNSNLEDPSRVSKSLNNMGLVYTEWKKYNEAILNFRESLKIEESLNHEGEAAIVINNLGRVYFYQNQYDSALRYFLKALEIQDRMNDLDQVALAYNNIGKVLQAQKKYEFAAQYLLSALDIYNKLGKEGEKSTVLANLSDINRAMGLNAKALQLLDSSTQIATKLNLRNQLQQNYLYYTDIYGDLYDYKQSLEYYKKYTTIKDSVFTDKILRQLSDFQIKYETEKKENEIQIQRLALKRQKLQSNFMLAVSCLLLALTGLIFYSLQVKKKDNRIIAEARGKSDQLLLNILPAAIAHDLKEKGKTEPKHFDNVTACFVDIVNFTQKTSAIDPVILIDELNQLFTAFDNIIEKNSCERIKTIGDSYMAVAGVPDPDPDHAFHIVNSCIEMIRFIKKRNIHSEHTWEIRIGIHTGEVIAGVVGIKKYIYDVFGDTINTASRMESNSEPMKINISESTFILLNNQFETEPRGELDVKGKGKLRMYFLNA